MKRETRYFQLEATETRAEVEGEKRVLKGYASVFNQWVRILPRLEESVAPGAFSESLAQDDIRALWNHNTNFPLARNRNGTLRLTEDEHGLRFEMEPNDTSWGRDAFEAIRRGDVTGMSFGFVVMSDEWTRGDDKTPHRRSIKKVKLYEVSPTPFPAYEGTNVSARSTEEALTEYERTLVDLEARALREIQLEHQKRSIALDGLSL